MMKTQEKLIKLKDRVFDLSTNQRHFIFCTTCCTRDQPTFQCGRGRRRLARNRNFRGLKPTAPAAHTKVWTNHYLSIICRHSESFFLTSPKNKILILLFLSFIVFTSCDHPDQNRFRAAQRLWDQGDYINAVQAYQLVVLDFPDSKYADDSLHMLGNTYDLGLQDPTRAIAAYERLVREYPESPFAANDQRRIAELYQYRYEDFGQALSAYTRLLALFPDYSERDRILYRMGQCLLEQGDYETFRKVMTQLIEKYPESERHDDAVYLIANSYYIEGKCETALDKYRDFIENNPDSSFLIEARFGIGKVLEEQEDLEGAIEVYEEILKEHPHPQLVEHRRDAVKKRLKERSGG